MSAVAWEADWGRGECQIPTPGYGWDEGQELWTMIHVAIHIREAARAAKLWSVSDWVRDVLEARAGVQLSDGADGKTSWRFG